MNRMDMKAILPASHPIIGMVHALPLPGSPRWEGSMAAVLDRAAADAQALADGGVDGIFVENYGDSPFYPGAVPPGTVAALTLVVREVIAAVRLPVGVNVLRNDAASALAIAAATGARFIRVNVHTGSMQTDQGPITGRAHETLRQRKALGVDAGICADVLVKHATPPVGTTYGQAAADTWERGLADVLIVSGAATGAPADLVNVRAVRDAVPEAGIWIGSGFTADSAAALLAIADGAIVGSAFQVDGVAGRPVERDRVARVMEAVHRLR
jgi:membrane complex biogenesis BtpA family protein